MDGDKRCKDEETCVQEEKLWRGLLSDKNDYLDAVRMNVICDVIYWFLAAVKTAVGVIVL